MRKRPVPSSASPQKRMAPTAVAGACARRLIGLAGPQRSVTSHSRLFAERNVALKVAYARRFWLTGVIR